MSLVSLNFFIFLKFFCTTFLSRKVVNYKSFLYSAILRRDSPLSQRSSSSGEAGRGTV